MAMESQQVLVQENDWMLVRFLDGDGSYWVVPAFYLQNFGRGDILRGELSESTFYVWNGSRGYSVSNEEAQHTSKFRPAKIFCVKESVCCAERTYHLASVIREESLCNSQKVMDLASHLQNPEEELNLSHAVAIELSNTVSGSQDISHTHEMEENAQQWSDEEFDDWRNK